jgi:hypothetical protein
VFWCEDAWDPPDELDLCGLLEPDALCDEDAVELAGELCVVDAECPLPFPGSAKAFPPPRPREMITSASTADTAATGRARSSHARNMEYLPIPEPRERDQVRCETGTELLDAPQ